MRKRQNVIALDSEFVRHYIVHVHASAGTVSIGFRSGSFRQGSGSSHEFK